MHRQGSLLLPKLTPHVRSPIPRLVAHQTLAYRHHQQRSGDAVQRQEEASPGPVQSSGCSAISHGTGRWATREPHESSVLGWHLFPLLSQVLGKVSITVLTDSLMGFDAHPPAVSWPRWHGSVHN